MNAWLAAALLAPALLTACGNPPAEPGAPSVELAAEPNDAPSWEIGEDIAGKTVVINGKEVVVPDTAADTKRRMDAAAKESLDAMDALEKKRLERFNDPDMKP